jgi:hypothetical protein
VFIRTPDCADEKDLEDWLMEDGLAIPEISRW